jgi:antigen flippase
LSSWRWGADFFPRIAAAKDEAEAQYLTEKQIQAGLLLALPLITVLLTMGRLCIQLLYANTFEAAIPLLSWMVWGVFLRLISWPMGYWMLARGSSTSVILAEVIGNSILAAMPIVLMPIYGLTGTAIGFFTSYVCYTTIMMILACRRSGRWLGWQTIVWFLAAAAILALAQWTAGRVGGLYGGLVPSLVVTSSCAWLYFKAIQVDES